MLFCFPLPLFGVQRLAHRSFFLLTSFLYLHFFSQFSFDRNSELLLNFEFRWRSSVQLFLWSTPAANSIALIKFSDSQEMFWLLSVTVCHVSYLSRNIPFSAWISKFNWPFSMSVMIVRLCQMPLRWTSGLLLSRDFTTHSGKHSAIAGDKQTYCTCDKPTVLVNSKLFCSNLKNWNAFQSKPQPRPSRISSIPRCQIVYFLPSVFHIVSEICFVVIRIVSLLFVLFLNHS